MLGTDPIESQDPTHDTSAAPKTQPAKSQRLLVWAVVVVSLVCVLGVGAIGLVAAKPCASCHDRGAFLEQTQASAHGKVACRRCHMSSGVVGRAVFVVRQPFHGYLAQSSALVRDASAVPDSRCRACHEEALKGVVVANGITINHASCATGASCTDCHSSTAHGTATRWVRSYDMDGCLKCHVELGKVGCDLCHQGKAVTARVKSTAFAVTHGPKWRTTHGMGDAATCSVCHVQGDCADCHGPGVPHEPKFVEVHASYAAEPKAKCASCHKEAFCTACHGTEMPHPAGFTPKHPELAKKQPDMCKRCHAQSDCTNCHDKHVHPGGAISAPAVGGGGQ